MRVLITGGTGFIGSYLVDRLVKEGFEVVVSTRADSSIRYLPAAAHRVETDLRDASQARKLLNGIDIVFHLASIRGSGWMIDDKEFYNTNVGTTRNILEGAADNGIRQFIYVSSVSVHGHAKNGPIRYNHPSLPATRYGWTKYHSEELVREYHAKMKLHATIIRPVITYGPRDTWGMVTKLIFLINSGRYLQVGNGENRLHLIYIDDLIDGMMLAIDSRTDGVEIFTLAGKEPITVNQLVKIIASLLDKKVPGIHFPVWSVKCAGLLMERFYRWLRLSKEPLVTDDKVDLISRDRYFDIHRSVEILGFSPMVDYENGLRKTLKWLKEEKHLH